MISKDIYVKLVDPSGKCSDVISCHTVWDEQRFMHSLHQTHEVKAKDEDVRQVVRATQAEYRKSKGYKPQHCV